MRWTSLVGCRAASSNVCLSAAGQAAVAAAEAAAQRRRTCRNALHEIGAAAECGVQYAPHKIGATAEHAVQYVGPIARSPDDANAGDQTRPAVVAPRGRAGIDPGLRSRNDGRGAAMSMAGSGATRGKGSKRAGRWRRFLFPRTFNRNRRLSPNKIKLVAAREPHESRPQVKSRMGIRVRGGCGNHSRGRRLGDDIFVGASAGRGTASAGGRDGCSTHLGCARSLAADDRRHTRRGATTDGTTGGQIACESVSYTALGRVACSRCVGEQGLDALP